MMTERRKRREWTLLAVVVLFWFAQYVYIPYQTPFLTGKGVAAGMIGTVVGAYGVTQMIFRLPVGVMADWAGRHRIFVSAGAALAALASMVRLLAPGGMGFLVANLIGGCASSMWISYMVLFSEYFSAQEQQKATSRVIMACNLGMCLGFVFSSLLYARTGMAFLCASGMAAGLLGLLISLGVREADENTGTEKRKRGSRYGKKEKGRVRQLLQVCGNRRLILFSCLALIQQGIQMSTAMSFTTQRLEVLGASSLFIGLASVFYMIAAVVSAQFASTSLCEKRGARFYVPVVFALTGLYCVLVPLTGSRMLIFLLQAFPGMSTGILLSYLTSESMKEVPEDKKSTAMGFFQAVYAVGMTGFPCGGGSVDGAVEYDGRIWISGGCGICGAWDFLLVLQKRRKVRGPAAELTDRISVKRKRQKGSCAGRRFFLPEMWGRLYVRPSYSGTGSVCGPEGWDRCRVPGQLPQWSRRLPGRSPHTACLTASGSGRPGDPSSAGRG